MPICQENGASNLWWTSIFFMQANMGEPMLPTVKVKAF